MTIADRVKYRREELGLTQTELAHKMGLRGKTSIADMESRGDRITLRNIEKLATALNCTETYLLGFENLDGSATYFDGKKIDEEPKQAEPKPTEKIAMDFVVTSGNMQLIIEMCQGRTEEQLAYLRKLLEVAVSNMK